MPKLIDSISLEYIIDIAQQSFKEAINITALENEKARFLGKSGMLTKLLNNLSELPPDIRKIEGAYINAAKNKILTSLTKRRQEIAEKLLNQRLSTESIDVTLPGRDSGSGSLHPIMRTWERIEKIFHSIGFDIAEGPEIENDWYNFTSLNSPEKHPARSMQDTFYIDGKDITSCHLLRTHMSSMQVRYARMNSPPIKVIALGRSYRIDNDATHSPMFNQVEGLWIDDNNLGFADLKGIYSDFLKKFFERDDILVRFRPSYFPFTEPSAEIDMMFESSKGTRKWLEISGSGQVHPTVINNMGLNSERYTGFAFGTGLERLTMLRYGIEDLRLFFENDLRFLRQFS